MVPYTWTGSQSTDTVHCPHNKSKTVPITCHIITSSGTYAYYILSYQLYDITIWSHVPVRTSTSTCIQDRHSNRPLQ